MTDRDHNLAVVEQFFSGPRELDRLTLMSEDCEWWNGMRRFPNAPGQTVFRGRDESGRIVLGRARLHRRSRTADASTATTSPRSPSPTSR
jgi:hypothetical protein